jgi:hypothetical protein
MGLGDKRGRPGEGGRDTMTARVFAVLAAVFLVGAFALATLLPADTTLLDGVATLDRDLPQRLHDTVIGWFGNRVWVHAAMPLLVRPIWLTPAGIGLICVGGAASFASMAGARPRRRRS